VLGGMTGDIQGMVTKGSGLAMDLENVLNTTTQEMKLAHADKALQRLTNIRESNPRIEEFVKEVKILSGEAGKFPKTMVRDNPINPELDGFLKNFQDLVAYKKHWDKHSEMVEAVYKQILKAVNK
jgi:hypothetical protein